MAVTYQSQNDLEVKKIDPEIVETRAKILEGKKPSVRTLMQYCSLGLERQQHIDLLQEEQRKGCDPLLKVVLTHFPILQKRVSENRFSRVEVERIIEQLSDLKLDFDGEDFRLGPCELVESFAPEHRHTDSAEFILALEYDLNGGPLNLVLQTEQRDDFGDIEPRKNHHLLALTESIDRLILDRLILSATTLANLVYFLVNTTILLNLLEGTSH
jgi:hypothetical protein